jgi:hypothetical protein
MNGVTTWHIRVDCCISKSVCMYAHAHAHAPGYPCAHTRVQACTHRPICNAYCFSIAHGLMNVRHCYIKHSLPVLFVLLLLASWFVIIIISYKILHMYAKFV